MLVRSLFLMVLVTLCSCLIYPDASNPTPWSAQKADGVYVAMDASGQPQIGLVDDDEGYYTIWIRLDIINPSHIRPIVVSFTEDSDMAIEVGQSNISIEAKTSIGSVIKATRLGLAKSPNVSLSFPIAEANIDQPQVAGNLKLVFRGGYAPSSLKMVIGSGITSTPITLRTNQVYFSPKVPKAR